MSHVCPNGPCKAAACHAACNDSSQSKPIARCDIVITARVLMLQMGSPRRAVYPQSGGAELGRACGRKPDLGARGYPSHDTPSRTCGMHACPASRPKPAHAPPATGTHALARSRLWRVGARLCALVCTPRALCVHSEYPVGVLRVPVSANSVRARVRCPLATRAKSTPCEYSEYLLCALGVPSCAQCNG